MLLLFSPARIWRLTAVEEKILSSNPLEVKCASTQHRHFFLPVQSPDETHLLDTVTSAFLGLLSETVAMPLTGTKHRHGS